MNQLKQELKYQQIHVSSNFFNFDFLGNIKVNLPLGPQIVLG